MKKLTNLIIIDASGSMQDKKNDVIGGLKQLLTQIKEDAERDVPTTRTATIITEFASSGMFKTLINSATSTDLDPKSAEQYRPGGGTALYDAIDRSFKLVSNDQESVFVTIFTDGEENDSKEMTYSAVKELIEDRKSKNWVITFMGTTEKDIRAAVNMGISAGNTMFFENSAIGASKSFSKMSNMRGTYYSAATGKVNMSTSDLQNLVEVDDKLNNTVSVSGNSIVVNSTTSKGDVQPIDNPKDDE